VDHITSKLARRSNQCLHTRSAIVIPGRGFAGGRCRQARPIGIIARRIRTRRGGRRYTQSARECLNKVLVPLILPVNKYTNDAIRILTVFPRRSFDIVNLFLSRLYVRSNGVFRARDIGRGDCAPLYGVAKLL
jgi:hypothetical protein